MSFKPYLSLTKPGIIFGNGIATVGGYFLGAQGHFSLPQFLSALGGIALVIASAGVFNNYFDRDIDRLMERTQNRPLARDSLSHSRALLWGTLLGFTGITVLGFGTNILATLLAGAGFALYIVAYTLWLKRSSVHGTLVGSFSGAIPPVVGYTAATGRFDLPAVLLMLALCFWQMPHSYAIGIYRANDFRKAHIPLYPLQKSPRATLLWMLFYALGFLVAASSLFILGFTGPYFGILVASGGLAWLVVIGRGFSAESHTSWARSVFLSSILLITLFSLMLVLNSHVAQ